MIAVMSSVVEIVDVSEDPAAPLSGRSTLVVDDTSTRLGGNLEKTTKNVGQVGRCTCRYSDWLTSHRKFESLSSEPDCLVLGMPKKNK